MPEERCVAVLLCCKDDSLQNFELIDSLPEVAMCSIRRYSKIRCFCVTQVGIWSVFGVREVESELDGLTVSGGQICVVICLYVLRSVCDL